jgi:hypothetical protein
MTTRNCLKIALVERGNPTTSPRSNPRLEPIFAALEALGVTAPPVLYSEATAHQARAQLLDCDGALVWVNPVTDGVDRTEFDALLRDVAAGGVWVSAHPDVILKMGVKAVLPRTKTLGWGSDAHCYDSAETFRTEFPARLAVDGVRVLKPNRGNGSQGVLKVELTPATAFPNPDSLLTIVEARDDVTEAGVRFGEFLDRFDDYLASGGLLIDQDLQRRVGEGLVRCYMCQDKVVGFSEQFPRNNAVGPVAPSPFGMLSDKTMHDETEPRFQGLRRNMETNWTPDLQALLDIQTAALPVLWDADFFYGPKTDGENSFVLCEINISCVIPFPHTAGHRIATAAIVQASEFKAAFGAPN